MKKISLLSLLSVLYFSLAAQNKYWQQEVNFTINVLLNDKEHTLDAFETIEYINHSPYTLSFIYFHLWPNAYKNDRTAFSDQLLRNRDTRFYFSNQQQKGYINQLDFKADGSNAATETDSNHIDVIKLVLSKPLAPGAKVIITTPFRVKLPYIFSRSGHIGHDYQVTQWFPKPAVFDSRGWHQMPYLDQGEFYSEFGNFDVEITTPSSYEVAATGVLQDAETLRQLKQNGKHTAGGNTKTWRYLQNNIHDFAWFASKDYMIKYDTATLPSGKVIDVFCYYKPKAAGWDKSMWYAKDGLKKYSSWLGDYPYATMTIVQGNPSDNSGGMEYPTITVISTLNTGRDLDATIVHEVGHNWFYGALASNERRHPWMDEGINSYYQQRYEAAKYKPAVSKKSRGMSSKIPAEQEDPLLRTMIKLHKDQSIETPADSMTAPNYGLVAYYKTATWMKRLEAMLGQPLFDSAMHNYYMSWQFKHPQPEDFKNSMETASGRQLNDIFSQLNTTGFIAQPGKKTIKPTFLFSEANTSKYNYVSIAPAVGYNHYDKGMIGGLIHNYQLPLNKFQFVAGALYATGSKRWNGFGNVSYNIYKRRQTIHAGLGYANYTMNDFATDEQTKIYQRMRRFTPSVNVTLFDKEPLSTRRYNIRWKTFLLREDALDFVRIDTPADTVELYAARTVALHSYINRLSVSVSDNRKLFPYSLTLSADQGREFVKAGVTGKYYFNYPDGKTGMAVRFFAGKFFYLKQQTFLTRSDNDRYLLTLSAPKGYEDYTYSDYFIGRNEFEGWQSQQVMERDGFFKVNTELLSTKVGKTDDWLMALNLSTGLPKKINPLGVLPFELPVKLFADIGTYAEAWKENPASGRFVYDAGVQLSLFNALVNVYVPVLYSKVYSNYYKSTITEKRFWKTISFTINLDGLSARELIKDLPL